MIQNAHTITGISSTLPIMAMVITPDTLLLKKAAG